MEEREGCWHLGLWGNVLEVKSCCFLIATSPQMNTIDEQLPFRRGVTNLEGDRGANILVHNDKRLCTVVFTSALRRKSLNGTCQYERMFSVVVARFSPHTSQKLGLKCRVRENNTSKREFCLHSQLFLEFG